MKNTLDGFIKREHREHMKTNLHPAAKCEKHHWQNAFPGDNTCPYCVPAEKSQIKVTIETRSPSRELQNVVNAVMRLNPVMRGTVSEMIQTRGFRSHVGGCHVAILADNGERLAMFTGNAPDWI